MLDRLLKLAESLRKEQRNRETSDLGRKIANAHFRLGHQNPELWKQAGRAIMEAVLNSGHTCCSNAAKGMAQDCVNAGKGDRVTQALLADSGEMLQQFMAESKLLSMTSEVVHYAAIAIEDMLDESLETICNYIYSGKTLDKPYVQVAAVENEAIAANTTGLLVQGMAERFRESAAAYHLTVHLPGETKPDCPCPRCVAARQPADNSNDCNQPAAAG